MKKIILVGAGGHAASCIDVIRLEKKFKIVGLVDNKKNVGESFMGLKILGNDKDLQKLKKLANYAFVSVGQVSVNSIRKKIYLKLVRLGFKIPKILSPLSYISKSATIEDGSIVHHGVIVNALSKIGKNCIINSKSLIEHGVKIGDHSHVATCCVINGNTEIGAESFLGSNSVIRNNIKIKKKSFIKMGERK